jgi:hypothetical protein
MALIPLQHVVADEFPVDSAAAILMGSFVKFDSDGDIVQATGAGAEHSVGIAGDTKSDSTASLPTTNASVIGTGNTTRTFVNRVSDIYDETKASAKMTVYHSGGKFATDQYDSTASYTPGDALYVGAAGQLQPTDAGSGQILGRVVSEGEFPSGVPGTDVDGDISLGTYLTFILNVGN